jgi:chromosomal replication initiator protein
MNIIWNDVKAALLNKIQDHCYRMWIDPLEFRQAEENRFILACPNPFSRRRIQDHYLSLIEVEFRRIAGASCQLSLEIREDRPLPERSQTNHHHQLPLPNVGTQPHGGNLLRSDFTFDQFVVGGNNDFAFSAAFAMAACRSNQQSALFLLSKTGMGKTHLSQAVGHHILSEFPQKRVFYMTAEDFTNEMVESFQNNTHCKFQRKYRESCDVLLLEDVQYLSGKDRTQVELAATFDTLFNAHKKIIFSSCCAPAEIPKLNDTLRSRLSYGIISNIQEPDFETRLRILKKKALRMELDISKSVLEFLADELVNDVRQLESGLIGISARSSLLGVPVDRDLAKKVVANIVRQRKKITIGCIKELVCKHYNVTIKDLESRSRKQAIVRPRQVAIYLARKYTGQPVQAIGRSFNRYHATALHAIGVVEKGIKNNSDIQRQVQYLCRKIESVRS